MGLVNISSFKKDIVRTEDDAISTGVGYILPEASEHSELAPLYYVHEFDSRIEYMNKIAKLLNPWLAYGMWQKDISRATFDNYVKDGKLPRGEHHIGFKELSWSKKDLDKYIKEFRNKNKTK